MYQDPPRKTERLKQSIEQNKQWAAQRKGWSLDQIKAEARARGQLALSLRRDGKTFRAIGAYFGGITPARAREIVLKAERQEAIAAKANN